MSKYANKRRIEGLTFKRGDIVYLIRRNNKTKRPSNKLDFKKLGLFKIEKQILITNYQLKLLLTIRIHLVFHISLLELAPKAVQPNKTIKIEDEEPKYEVEAILDSRLVPNQSTNDTKYLIKWKEYSQNKNT